MKDGTLAKIIPISKLSKLHLPKKKTVLAGGAFDIIHPGHIRHIEVAKNLGDILIVHITGDRRLKEKKGRNPVFSDKDRARIISSIKGVDYVFIYNGRHYDQKIVDLIRPSVIFFNDESYRGNAQRYIKNKLRYSGKIIVSKAKKIHSSSKIIQKLKNC